MEGLERGRGWVCLARVSTEGKKQDEKRGEHVVGRRQEGKMEKKRVGRCGKE